MPIGYGDSVKLISLPTESVTYQQDKSFGIISTLRAAITIVEIATAFIPGINVLTETAVGLTAGGINQYLDKQSGSQSAVGSVLNFGAPLVGGSFAFRSNLTRVNNIERGLLGNTSKTFSRGTEMDKFIDRRFNRFKKTTYKPKTDYQLKNFGQRKLDISAYDTLRSRGRYSLANNPNIFKNNLNKVLNTIAPDQEAVFQQTLNLFGASTKPDIIGNELRRGLEDYAKKVLSGRVISSTDNVTRELVEDKNYLKRLGFTDEQIRQLLELSIRQGQKATRKSLLELRILLSTMNLTGRARIFAKQFELGIQAILDLSPEISETTAIYRAYQDALKRVSPKEPFSRKYSPAKIWKYLGTREFNDRVVQPIQAVLDPNDHGRAYVEFAYRNIMKILKKNWKTYRKLQKVSESLGGINLDSQWLMSYKIVKQLGRENLILINFIPEATNNKHPVLVWATHHQIKKLIESPGRTYQRYWAVSKGGRSVGLSGLFGNNSLGAIKLTKNAMHLPSVMGWIPVQQLRNILSIVSNVVENVNSLHKGEYFNTYMDKFIKSLKNTAVSRTFRLVAKGVLGPLAGIHFGHNVGRVVGKELQRVGTQILAQGIKNVMNKKNGHFFDGIRQHVISGTLISIRSHSLRSLRSRAGSGSVVVNTLAGSRKFRQIKRIPNAVVPGRPFSGIKTGRKKPKKYMKRWVSKTKTTHGTRYTKRWVK